MGDYSPGRCSEGGMGNIKQVHRGCEGTSGNADVTMEDCSLVDVQYVLTGWVEKNIPLTRLTAVPFTWKVVYFLLFLCCILLDQICYYRNLYQPATFDPGKTDLRAPVRRTGMDVVVAPQWGG